MTINAKEKFENAIINGISEYKMISERNITDLEELESIMETATGKGHSLGAIKCMYHLLEASAEEYTYENGLIYLISEIKFDTGTNIRTITQKTLTSDYNEVPIANIVIERQRKSIKELLISSTALDENIPENMKDIESEKTIIYVNNKCGSAFESYTTINNLIIEKYKQYYPLSKYEDSVRDLIRICGHGSRYLEIIYSQNNPIYAQLSDKYKVEMAGFNPNSAKDAETIVNIINEEVDLIVNTIQSSIHEYVNKKDSFAKELKRKND